MVIGKAVNGCAFTTRNKNPKTMSDLITRIRGT